MRSIAIGLDLNKGGMAFTYWNGAPELYKPERFSKGQSKAEDAEERLSHQITLQCARATLISLSHPYLFVSEPYDM